MDFIGQLAGYDPLRSLGGISSALGQLLGQTAQQNKLNTLLGETTEAAGIQQVGNMMGRQPMGNAAGSSSSSPSMSRATDTLRSKLDLKRGQLLKAEAAGFGDYPQVKALRTEVSQLEKELSDAKSEEKELAKNQAAPQEVQQKLDELISRPEWRTMSPEQKYVEAAKAGIPSTYIDGLIKSGEQSTAHEEGRWKATADYRNLVSNQYLGAQQTIQDLDRMVELEKEGSFPSPEAIWGLNFFGIPLGVLRNADAEEFESLSKNLFNDIRNIFGNRILEIEMQNFLKTIPRLVNSPEGRQRIIRNMQRLKQGLVLQYETMEEIKRENGGVPPYDLQEQTVARLAPKLQKLADDFKKDMEIVRVQKTDENGKVRIYDVPRMELDQLDLEAEGGKILG